MKKIIYLFTLINIFLSAQTQFDFEFDYAQFGYDSTANYVEFYYSFNQASFQLNLKTRVQIYKDY